MNGDNEQIDGPEWLREMPLRSEEIGFAPDELVRCEQCGKPNGPDRSVCLYCGAPIAGTLAPRIKIRELESWENGFNVIAFRQDDSAVEQAAQSLASMLGRDPDLIAQQLGSQSPIPVIRLDSEEQAGAVCDLLSEHGIKSRIVRDYELVLQAPPVRLRAITFAPDDVTAELTLFNLDERIAIGPNEIVLIVVGMALESRTESIERRKRKGLKTLNETATTSDELVIDIYTKENPTGWRIRSSGFDFSFLGDRKSLLVGENMQRLIDRLLEFSPETKFVDDYLKVRQLLEDCWPAESRRDETRLGFAKKDFSNVFTINNATQLTKYSRLQWHLL